MPVSGSLGASLRPMAPRSMTIFPPSRRRCTSARTILPRSRVLRSADGAPAPAAVALLGAGRVFETQRQRIVSCFAQRRRQRRNDALQAGFHQNAGAALAEIHARTPGGAAAELPQQRLPQRRLQRRRIERAVRIDGNAAVALAGDADRDRSTQKPRVDRAHAHAAVAEFEPAAQLRHRRPVGIDAYADCRSAGNCLPPWCRPDAPAATPA